VFAFAWVFAGVMAFAQDGHSPSDALSRHGQGHAENHDWYQQLKQPGTGFSCCNGTTNGVADPKSDTATVSFTVWEVNDAPVAVNDTLANMAEDSGPRTIPSADLTGNDSSGAANETLVPVFVNVGNAVGGTVTLVNGVVTFTPAADYFGPASFQYTVQDNGTTNGGADFKTSNTVTATFTVTAVNDAPVNTVPGAQNVAQNTSLTFSAANSNLISIADVDAGTSAVQVQLTATNGVITLSGISGLSFTVGDGTADATMTFTGTIANINAVTPASSADATSDSINWCTSSSVGGRLAARARTSPCVNRVECRRWMKSAGMQFRIL